MRYDPEKFRLKQLHGHGEGPYMWRTRPIHVPIAVVLGLFEHLTTQELEDLRDDVHAEMRRRDDTRTA